MLKYAIGHCVRRYAKRFFSLGLVVTKQQWTQFRHRNTSFAVFDVRSCAAVGEADPNLFTHANQRVLMRIYVQYRQCTEKKIDDTISLGRSGSASPSQLSKRTHPRSMCSLPLCFAHHAKLGLQLGRDLEALCVPTGISPVSLQLMPSCRGCQTTATVRPTPKTAGTARPNLETIHRKEAPANCLSG